VGGVRGEDLRVGEGRGRVGGVEGGDLYETGAVRVGEGCGGGKGAARSGELPGMESSSIESLKAARGVAGLCWTRCRRRVGWEETVRGLRR
jgi:hypothetical protein